MTYYTGAIVAVPTGNRQSFIERERGAWVLFRKFGATRMVNAWGVDVPKGKVNDFHGAVNAKSDETVTFSWIEWRDKATADAAWQNMQADPATMQQMPQMPFDGSRMIVGGFELVFAEGADQGARYIQGFALAVPEKNKSAYIDMARTAWESAFKRHGCLGLVEAWGVDVPHGKQTDFYRASLAEAGEVPVLSWAAWPDKATCDAAARAMQAMEGPSEMPFDGKRMMWGGFEPVSDSAAASRA